TFVDFLPGYEASFWGGFRAPKSTPAEVIETLNRAINAALSDPRMQARLADLGATPFGAHPLISASTLLPKSGSGPKRSRSPASRRSNPRDPGQIFRNAR